MNIGTYILHMRMHRNAKFSIHLCTESMLHSPTYHILPYDITLRMVAYLFRISVLQLARNIGIAAFAHHRRLNIINSVISCNWVREPVDGGGQNGPHLSEGKGIWYLWTTCWLLCHDVCVEPGFQPRRGELGMGPFKQIEWCPGLRWVSWENL